jgi:hypothetical protein
VASFKIVDSFRGPPGKFVVSMLDGGLTVGDVIPLWETRHRANFTVISTNGSPEALEVEVREPIPWDHAWRGATADTNNPELSRKHGYSI